MKEIASLQKKKITNNRKIVIVIKKKKVPSPTAKVTTPGNFFCNARTSASAGSFKSNDKTDRAPRSANISTRRLPTKPLPPVTTQWVGASAVGTAFKGA